MSESIAQTMKRHDLSNAVDQLHSPKVFKCYHCGEKSARLSPCELWGISSCPTCITELHAPHHKSCKKEVPKPGANSAPKAKYEHRPTFTLRLTHFTGNMFFIRCALGQQIEMEDHPLGTYILTTGTMTLVLEHRNQINDAILEGLRSIHPD